MVRGIVLHFSIYTIQILDKPGLAMTKSRPIPQLHTLKQLLQVISNTWVVGLGYGAG